MNSKCARIERDGEIALVVVHNPPVNTITAEVRAGLSEALEAIRAGEKLRAVVLLCEGSTFFSGADIGEFAGPPREVEYRILFNGFEALEIPVVAAMHGTVMGGGLEIALACHYRVAAPTTRFALPEVTLGIIPGAGGTQRLPRLIGAERALDFILSAKPVGTSQAKDLGFLDDVVEGDLRAGAIGYARALLAAGKGPRRTGAMNVDSATATDEIFQRMTAQARKLYPNRNAGLVAVEAVRKASQSSLAEGLEFETALANDCKKSVESRGAIHVFFAERDCRRVPGIGEEISATPVKSAGVIGAGTMGGGIAICFANAGIPVTLLDATDAALERGLANVDRIYQSMVDRGRLTADEKAQRMARIRTSLDYEQLRDADVIVEAVFESMDLKREVFAKLDAVARRGAVLATNTSTLDIEAIANATSRPEDVIGMHFFSPANVMPLLEVVRTDAHITGRHQDGHGAGQAAAQDAGARQGLLWLHRQPDDGRLRTRGAAHGAGRRLSAPGRRCARRLGHGDGNSRRLRHGGRRRGRECAPGQRIALSARSLVLPGRRRACTRRDGSGRRAARVTTATSRVIARASTIPTPSKSFGAARANCRYLSECTAPARSRSAACSR